MTNNLRAAGLMALGMTFLTFNDAIVKYVSGSLSVPQILFIRGLIASSIFIIIIKFSRHGFNKALLQSRVTFLRGFLEASATLVFITALSLLPIAVATTLVFASPMLLTLIGAVVFKETVKWRRWTAVITGFIGVALVSGIGVQSWSWPTLLPLLTAFLAAGRDLTTRYIDAELPSTHIALVTAILVTIFGLLALPFKYSAIDGYSLLWLSGAGALICCAYFFYISAIRLGELSFVAPFNYTSIIIAVILGMLIWDDTLSRLQLLGIVLIISSGLLIAYRSGNRRTATE